MIGISDNLIRTARAATTYDVDDKSTAPSNYLETLLSSSPPDSITGGGKDAEARLALRGAAPKKPLGPPIAPDDDGMGSDDEEEAQVRANEAKQKALEAKNPAAAAAAQQKEDEKKLGKTRVVKFTYDESSDTAEMLSNAAAKFNKEQVKPPKFASSLSQQLSDTGALHRAGRANFSRPIAPSTLPGITPKGGKDAVPIGGPPVNLKAYLPTGGKVKLQIPSHCPVEHVIQCILEACKSQKVGDLRGDTTMYELRMVDDDDGSPDTDIPPLDRARDFQKYRLDTVALCEKEGVEMKEDPKEREMARAAAGSVFMKPGNKIVVKVLMDQHESHMLAVVREMAIEELLPLLSKKKKESAENPMLAKEYNFFAVEGKEPLSMQMKVGDLKYTDFPTLKLVSKMAAAGVSNSTGAESIQQTNNEPTPSQFLFTKETAGTYCEYKVIKTNDRGKRQERTMAIDRTRIWNKQGKKPGQKRRISFDVSRAHRPIASVHSCSVNPGNAACFEIVYKESGKLSNRQYEAETKLECAEIVAKINFLMANQDK